MSTALLKNFSQPPISRREILRYMGCKDSSAEIDTLISRLLGECLEKLRYTVVYRSFPITFSNDGIDLGFSKVTSCDLGKCLNGCSDIILFAATVGLEIDRLIVRYGHSSPSAALCLQAIGNERVEALCDAFCEFIREEYQKDGRSMRPRFSAGYGDLPLELQRDIFRALNCEKLAGLTLNDSLLMSPTKSVTAIIGIK